MNSEEHGFIKICPLKDLKEKSGKKFFLEENEIAVFRVEGEIYAVSNQCPHQLSANIYDGFIEDRFVVCPVHGWMFDLKTGKTPSGGNGLIIYETCIIEEDVYVKVKKKEWKW